MFRFVLTLANSIIGVSILAMPFCFKQCGIVLASLMLVASGVIVKLTCHLLLKSAVLARRRNYELLAFQTFGPAGKLSVEMSMIGFLLGTCTAFFVVMGDLAPPIVARVLGIEPTDNLRLFILVGLGLFVALPLALLRNVESLAGICTASIGFYLLVLLHIVVASWPKLVDGSWAALVNYWRPAGIFQCLPIFCMALSCQPQVFEIYDALSDPSVNTMTDVVKGAVNLCSGCYISVGIFGYIAFCGTTEVGGNILTSFPSTIMVEAIKLGFVLSVAVSFPLVIFPCRTSIHSLVFRKGGNNNVPTTEIASNFIPPDHFNMITVFVILLTLTLGIIIPDIEFVLGMVGSTIGCAICVVFPALIFIKLTSKNTTERLAAQAVLAAGLAIMVLGTYVNLYEANRGPEEPYNNHLEEVKKPLEDLPPVLPVEELNQMSAALKGDDMNVRGELVDEGKREGPEEPQKEPQKGGGGESKRKEPVAPKPPPGVDVKEKSVDDTNDIKSREKQLEQREQKAEKLIEELEEQKHEQKQLIEEQKEVLSQLKEEVQAKDHKNQEQAKRDEKEKDANAIKEVEEPAAAAAAAAVLPKKVPPVLSTAVEEKKNSSVLQMSLVKDSKLDRLPQLNDSVKVQKRQTEDSSKVEDAGKNTNSSKVEDAGKNTNSSKVEDAGKNTNSIAGGGSDDSNATAAGRDLKAMGDM